MGKIRGERGFQDYLIYAYMAAPGVMALKNGSYMIGYRYTGPDIGSSTFEEIEHLCAMTNSALRRVGNGWMAHFESIRKPANEYPAKHFTEPTNILIDMERETQHKLEGAHFETAHFLFFTYLPPAIEKSGVYRKVIAGLEITDAIGSSEEHTIEYIENTITNILDVLGQSTKMRRLGFIPGTDSNGNYSYTSGYDDMLALVNYFINGVLHPIRLTCESAAYLDVMLARDAFLSTPIMIDNKYVCSVSLLEYPRETYPGILQQLMLLPYELRWSNRFIFTDYKDAQATLESYRRKWHQKTRGFIAQIMQNYNAPVNQDAVGMVGDIDNAMEELAGNWVGYGHHTSTVIARGSSKSEAEHIGREIVKIFERNGFPARIESVNAMEAFLGSLPGHGWENVRKPYINSLNLTHIVPLTNEWAGEAYNPSPEIAKHYAKEGVNTPAPALIQATSTGSTPFRLNLHVSDLGHTLILGPSGSGKSTLLALIASQFERYLNAQIFCFDKGYSMFPMCMAQKDSVHYDLGKDGSDISLCPLSEIDTVTDQGIASEWLESLLVLQGGEVTPSRRTAISDAVRILANSTAYNENVSATRTMTAYISTLQDEELREIYSYYTLGKTGEMVDGKSNDIQYSKMTVFELEHLFDMDKKINIPVFVHIFKQIEKRILSAYENDKAGRPSLIIIDEAWLALSDPIFAAKIKEWLKVLRKNNCAVVLATQSLADVVNSPIMDAILDSCETRLLLPNPNALSENMKDLYMRHLALNEQQVEIIAHAEKKREYFYACETMNAHRLFSLQLGPVALSFTGASGKEDLVEIRKLHLAYGNLWPEKWLEHRGLREWAARWHQLYEYKQRSEEEFEEEMKETA